MIANLPVWVVRVVDYHTLYDRGTVEGPRASLTLIDGLETRFSDLLNSDVTIPNLSDVGLDFRRGQVLKFEG